MHRNSPITELHSSALQARRSFIDIVTDDVGFKSDGANINQHAAPGTSAVLLHTEPTRRAHNQIAGRADIPMKLYQRVREHHGLLYEHMLAELYPKTPSLCRLRARDDAPAVLRAVLSDRYQVIDNVDVLTTMLQAFVDSGLDANEVQIAGDLDADDGLLRLRCTVPHVAVAARELVQNYRSPFDKRPGNELPMIFAGVEVSNHETGGGALSILPRAVMQICNNGMTRNAGDDVFRKVHLGARLEAGTIQWSEDTRRKQLELLAAAAKDAITTFVSPEYLRRMVDEASVAAGVELVDVQRAVSHAAKVAQLTDDEASGVLRMFIESGDTSVLGIAHAVTAHAQRVEESDRQSELEQAFWTIVSSADAIAVA